MQRAYSPNYTKSRNMKGLRDNNNSILSSSTFNPIIYNFWLPLSSCSLIIFEFWGNERSPYYQLALRKKSISNIFMQNQFLHKPLGNQHLNLIFSWPEIVDSVGAVWVDLFELLDPDLGVGDLAALFLLAGLHRDCLIKLSFRKPADSILSTGATEVRCEGEYENCGLRCWLLNVKSWYTYQPKLTVIGCKTSLWPS